MAKADFSGETSDSCGPLPSSSWLCTLLQLSGILPPHPQLRCLFSVVATFPSMWRGRRKEMKRPEAVLRVLLVCIPSVAIIWNANCLRVVEKPTAEPQEDKTAAIPPQKDIFTWRDVTYDIQIKGEPRRLLDHVSGWVKPGTLTALMGVSGAGKTTLLDVLAQRTSVGVITGDMLVNGKPLDSSFQRSTGYVQQQDLHLETTTVREALRFSAMLRQPKTVSKAEKYTFVEEVIDMLGMQSFAEAIVGVPGEGLNVEQRKVGPFTFGNDKIDNIADYSSPATDNWG